MNIFRLLCLTCALLCLPAYALEADTPLDTAENELGNPIYQTGDINSAIEEYEAEHENRSVRTEAREHLRDVLIGFILELLLSLIVLKLAFNLIGFPSLFTQLALLSIVVALTGAAMEYFLFIGLLNPIRVGLSFIILLMLIRQLTDVREWATAIQIALLARLISLVLMWLALAGVMMLFSL